MRREGDAKQRRAGRREGPPDLDLDLVEEEAQEEEERRRRSQRPRQKEQRDGQREKAVGSRSSPRIATRPRDTSPPKEKGEERSGVVRGRSQITPGQRARGSEHRGRGNDREEAAASPAKDCGSWAPAQRSAFSFLRPLEAGEGGGHVSDDGSASSPSEVSLSAASIATAGWGEDWGAASPWQQGRGPGPWVKPSSQRLTQVLVGHRLRGQRVAGGLSL